MPAKEVIDVEDYIHRWAWKIYEKAKTKEQEKLNSVDLEVKVDWSRVKFVHLEPVYQSPSLRPRPQALVLYKAQYANKTSEVQEYSLSTTRTSRSSCGIELSKAVTTGFDLRFALKTPGEVFETNAGYKRETTVQSTDMHVTEEELSWSQDTLIKVPAKTLTTAELTVKEQEYHGTFEAESYFYGRVSATFYNKKNNNSFVSKIEGEVVNALQSLNDTPGLRFDKSGDYGAPVVLYTTKVVDGLGMAGDHAEDDQAVCKNTLFVRNLLPATTNEQLEECFSQVGPVKQCFVVKERGSVVCKGYGYVIFAIRDDAAKAKEEITSIGGRKVSIKFARRKFLSKATSNKKAKGKDDESTGTKSGDTESIEKGVKKKQLVPTDNKSRSSSTRSDISAFVGKQAKLIVRNLSFKCNEEKLRELFSAYGSVLEVTIPKKNDGKMKGFAFVRFKHKLHADKALSAMNRKAILGRPVAVDWAVGRDTYLKAVVGNTPQPTEDEQTCADCERPLDVDRKSASSARQAEKLATARASGTLKKEEETPVSASKRPAAKSHLEDSKVADSSEEESEVDSDSIAKSLDAEEDAVQEEQDDDEEDSSERGTDADDDDEEEESCASDADDDGETSAAVRRKNGPEERRAVRDKGTKSSSDVSQGRTVFIRNLSFLTTEASVKELFERFGEVVYAKVVIDGATGRPKGMAFVQFKSKSAADECLAAASPGGDAENLTLDGRVLAVTLAVSRDDARDLSQKDKKSKKDGKDNRNLFLVREGMIRPGTKAAEGLDEVDLRKRSKLEAVKRQKLKNPNMFVSTTRLSVHNIPVNVDDKQLKQIFLKHAGNSGARITECRVMRDLGNVNSQGIAKSRGYAFVNFSEHEHALHALRQVNNNPDIFGPKKRPIVEFSIENRSVLELKQKRQERSKFKQATLRGEAPPKKGAPKKAVKIDRSADTKNAYAPKGLPKHWGPKIRHRPRNQSKPDKKAKAGAHGKLPEPSRAAKRRQSDLDLKQSVPEGSKPKKHKKREKREVKDSFDVMLSKYRQKFSGMLPAKRSKWFE